MFCNALHKIDVFENDQKNLDFGTVVGGRNNEKSIKNDAEIVEWLLETAEVAAVPGTAFGLEPYFRVSYATSIELLKEAMSRIEKVVLSLS